MNLTFQSFLSITLEPKLDRTVFGKMSAIMPSNNIKKIIGANLEKNLKRSILGPIWALFSQNLRNQYFLEKTSMQKFKKILGAVFE